MRRAFLHILTASAVLAFVVPAAHGQSFLNRPVNDWLNDLGPRNPPDVRRSAAFALGKIGAEGDAGRVLDALTQCLHDDQDATVRDGAAFAVRDVMTALGNQGKLYWVKAGPTLQQALKDAAPSVRRSAACAIGSFGPAAVPARDELIAALSDEKAIVRQNAAWALGNLGQDPGQDAVVKPLRGLLRDDDPLVRRDAMHALGEIGNPTAHPAVSAMMRAAGTESNGVVRKAAVEALSKLALPDDQADSHSLYPLLADKDSETRYGAAIVLAMIGGPEAAEAAPVLREALLGDDPNFQKLAAANAGRLGEAGEPVVDALAKVMTESKDSKYREYAAISLAQIGPPAAKALPQILQVLEDGDAKYREIRFRAAEVLHAIRMPGVEPAIPTVLKIIKSDREWRVRQGCVWALFDVQRLDDYGVTPVLTAVLDERDPMPAALVRYDAARLLAFALHENAPDKTPDVLLEMLKNRNLYQYNGSSTQTSGVGAEGVGGKTEVREEKGGDSRWMAAEALGLLGPKANRPDVVKALQDATQDKDAKLREEATKALNAIK